MKLMKQKQEKREGTKSKSILLMLFSVIFIVLLLSYDPRNFSLNSTSIYYESNVFYNFRNVIADFLLQIFGKTIYVVPIVLLIWSYKLFTHQTIALVITKLTLLFCILITMPPLFYVSIDEYSAGILGAFIPQHLEFFYDYSNAIWVAVIIIIMFIASIRIRDFVLVYFIVERVYIFCKSYLIRAKNKLFKNKITANETEESYNSTILNVTPDLDFVKESLETNLQNEKREKKELNTSINFNFENHTEVENKRLQQEQLEVTKIKKNRGILKSLFNLLTQKPKAEIKTQNIKSQSIESLDKYKNNLQNAKNKVGDEGYSANSGDNYNNDRHRNYQENLEYTHLQRGETRANNSYNYNEYHGNNESFNNQSPSVQRSYSDSYTNTSASQNNGQNEETSKEKSFQERYRERVSSTKRIKTRDFGSNEYQALDNMEVSGGRIAEENQRSNRQEDVIGQIAQSKTIQQKNTKQDIAFFDADKNIAQNYSVSIDFLDIKKSNVGGITAKEAKECAFKLESIINEFGINGKIVSVKSGPVVTLYEISIPAGVKTAKLISLETDIALRMKAVSVRIAVVTGKDVVGIEIPNVNRKTIFLKEVFKKNDFIDTKASLPLALGYDIYGNTIIADLVTMPHLLIAGTTGSGKSVGVNSMILSMLYKLPPDKCKLIMIDPKMLELSVYQDIPHLLTPVVINPKEAITALKWVVKEMEYRYYQMSLLGVRNVKGFNDKIENKDLLERTKQNLYREKGVDLAFNYMPYIVVIIDEMADLMMVAGKEVEAAVQRLAQMARASGIHLIMATQRPSADVITGTIKSNFPTRISFQVSSNIDSRIILGETGGERLLGKGDMLYMSGVGRIQRVHGPFVSDDEVGKVVKYLKTIAKPNYVNNITSSLVLDGDLKEEEDKDELYEEAISIIQNEGKVSTSFLQRKFQIGYNRAARIVEQLEEEGIVSKPNASGRRDVLIK